MSPTQPWMTMASAWQQALYGPAGFYRDASPVEHFRTSVHASPLFAGAVARLARERGLQTVVDLGCGGGELLRELHRIDPDLDLVGVELRPRPPAVEADIGWLSTLPDGIDGLLVANELLDDVACDVVERDASGIVREVEVQPVTGRERLGAEVGEPIEAWVDRWWPIDVGGRAEVGLAREDFWADACARVRRGACLAIDYGHCLPSRPVGGSLMSYRHGRQRPLSLDGHHDVTASVALDALADRVGGTLSSQRETLHRLGVDGRRPPVSLATTEPAAYVRALASASEAAELTATDGLGGFGWLLTDRGADVAA